MEFLQFSIFILFFSMFSITHFDMSICGLATYFILIMLNFGYFQTLIIILRLPNFGYYCQVTIENVHCYCDYFHILFVQNLICGWTGGGRGVVLNF